MVSVRLLHAIANKKGALIVVIDTSQPINKQMFVLDSITESFVCRVSLCSLRSLTTVKLKVFGSVKECKLTYPLFRFT